MSYNAIIELFENVLKAEQTVITLYQQVNENCKNKEIKKELELIMKDESKHLRNAQDALRILET
jgi:rubrerythrin